MHACKLALLIPLILLVGTSGSNADEGRSGGAVQTLATPRFVITGRLKEEGAAKGIGKARVRVIGLSNTNTEEALEQGLEFETDAEGRFRFEGEYGAGEQSTPGFGRIRLRLLDSEYAFPEASIAWVGFTAKAGEYKVGDILVVKGGQIHIKAVHQDTGEPISLPLYLTSSRGWMRDIPIEVVNGSGTSEVLPPGEFKVATGTDNAAAFQMVKVAAGETTEVEFRALPRYLVEVEFFYTASEWDRGPVYARPLGPNEEFDALKKRNPSLPGLYFPIADHVGKAWLNEGDWEVVVCDSKKKPIEKHKLTVPLAEPKSIFIGKSAGIRATAADREGNPMFVQVSLLDSKGTLADRYRKMLPGSPCATGAIASNDHNDFSVSVWQGGPARCGIHAGTYVLIAVGIQNGRSVVMVCEDNVTIKKGEVREFHITPPESRLSLQVTNDGAPAAQTELCVWQGKPPSPDDCTYKTDAQGRLDIPLAMGHWYVTTPRELAWCSAAVSATDEAYRLYQIAEFRVLGVPHTQALEIGPKARAWVAIETTGDNAEGLKVATLAALGLAPDQMEDWRGAEGGATDSGRRFDFANVRPGKYLLRVFNDEQMFLKLIEVKPGDNTFNVGLSSHKLSLSASLPGGSVPSDVEFEVRPAVQGYHTTNRSCQRVDAERGRAELTVHSGSYRVVARVKQGNEILNVGSQLVEISTDTAVAIEMSKDTGSITLKYRTRMEAEGSIISGRRVVAQFDSKVILPDPDEAFGWTNGTWTIHGLPDGNYTFELRGETTLPMKVKAQIKKGGNVIVDDPLKFAGRCLLEVTNVTANELGRMLVACTALRKGREMAYELPDASFLPYITAVKTLPTNLPDDAKLLVTGIPAGADALRLTLRDHQELLVALPKDNDQVYVMVLPK